MKLYGPFAGRQPARGDAVLQKIFQFRTCSLDIEGDDERWRWFRPCLLAQHQPVHGPLQSADQQRRLPRDIRRLRLFLEGKQIAAQELHAEMQQAPQEFKYEKAARIRDDIECPRVALKRANWNNTRSRKCSIMDPKKGLAGLQKGVAARRMPRRSKAWTSPIFRAARNGRQPGAVHRRPAVQAWLSAGIKIRSVEGVDDFASDAGSRDAPVSTSESGRRSRFPIMLLIDGGKGQLNARVGSLDDIWASSHR